jgi:hypothetical protein
MLGTFANYFTVRITRDDGRIKEQDYTRIKLEDLIKDLRKEDYLDTLFVGE